MEEKLIESVYRYDGLQQIKSQEHKDARCKENASKKVSEETGLPGADCQIICAFATSS